MRTRGANDPWPDAWTGIVQRLSTAIDAEKQRRRERGDTESVARYERGWARWFTEYERNPDLRAQSEEEVMEDTLRGIDHGWRKWMPPVQRRGMQSFFRGELSAAEYADGPGTAAHNGAFLRGQRVTVPHET